MVTGVNSRARHASGKFASPGQGCAGFTMFEMVAFIITVAIIYSVAVNRFSEFPEAAERANFQAVLTQLQSGLNLELMLGVSSGLISSIRQYEAINPMDLMLKTPSNYLGAYDSRFIDEMELERRSWYYDTYRGELVYLVNEAENVYLLADSAEVPTNEIRFNIVALYRDPDSLKNLTYEELEEKFEAEAEPNADEDEIERRLAAARISGAVLRPVTPFKWEAPEIDLEGEIEATGGFS